MPRKRRLRKTTKRQRNKSTKSTVSVSKLRKMIQAVRWTESYTSLLMGIVVVVVGVLFAVSFIKQTHHIQETSSTSTIATTSTLSQKQTVSPSTINPSERTYTVQKGDDLWHIAEKYYKSGYNWTDIARVNHLASPNDIFSGNQLVIPNVTPQPATVSPTPSAGSVAQANAITGSSYTVQKGDDLWHIAVRAYADGYQWVKIAKANNLSNPSLIFSGNALIIPR